MRLSKPSKRDSDPLEVGGHCSFPNIRGHVTLNCWAFRKHIKDLVQRGYLDEFVLELEEDLEVRDTPDEVID